MREVSNCALQTNFCLLTAFPSASVIINFEAILTVSNTWISDTLFSLYFPKIVGKDVRESRKLLVIFSHPMKYLSFNGSMYVYTVKAISAGGSVSICSGFEKLWIRPFIKATLFHSRCTASFHPNWLRSSTFTFSSINTCVVFFIILIHHR